MVENSKIDKKAVKWIVAISMLLIAMVVFTIYRWLDIGFIPRMQLELYAEMCLIGLLIVRCVPKYSYKLGNKSLLVTKKGIINTVEHEVSYKDIIGLYLYTPQLAGSPIKFRLTLRMNNALDNRDVWTLAYTAINKKKIENRRMYLKMSDEFLEGLNKHLPNNVKLDLKR